MGWCCTWRRRHRPNAGLRDGDDRGGEGAGVVVRGSGRGAYAETRRLPLGVIRKRAKLSLELAW
jgi:hypothetical protein